MNHFQRPSEGVDDLCDGFLGYGVPLIVGELEVLDGGAVPIFGKERGRRGVGLGEGGNRYGRVLYQVNQPTSETISLIEKKNLIAQCLEDSPLEADPPDDGCNMVNQRKRNLP